MGRSPTGRSVRTDSTSAPARHRDVPARGPVRVRCGTSHRTTERHGHGARTFRSGSTAGPAALTPHPGGARPGSPPWPRTTLTHADRARQMLSCGPARRHLPARRCEPALLRRRVKTTAPAISPGSLTSGCHRGPTPNGAGASVAHEWACHLMTGMGTPPGRTFDFTRLRCNTGYGFPHRPARHRTAKAVLTKGK